MAGAKHLGEGQVPLPGKHPHLFLALGSRVFLKLKK